MVDLTPGFNLSHWGPIPYIAATGTKTPLGFGSDSSSAAQTTAVDPNKEVGQITLNGHIYGVNAGGDPIKDYGPVGGNVLGDNTAYQPGGGSGATAQDIADEQAYWQDQIDNANQQLGRLPNQQQIGERNIQNSYQSAYDRLLGDKATTQRDYTTKRDQTVQDNITAKNNIDTGVRNQNTALQRLLGSRGAGSSSAARVLAPYAAALQGNQQRAQVQTSYGRNLQGLDTAWGDYQGDWTNSVGDLGVQRDTNLSTLRSGIDETKAKLLQAQSDAALQKAQAGGASYQSARAARAPYTQRINSILAQIDSLGKAPTFTPKTVAYQAPDLASYDYSATGAPTVNSGVDPTQASNVGAYWTLLNQDKKKNQLA